ncbi:MAG: histidinol-phosphate transaminase [Oligoflexia bacterium]|nr:histidinol-phosphate transaminase [Oligoflexia bacterium]
MYIICEHIKKLRPYVPGKPVEELEREFGISGSVKMASNENPWGCSESVIPVIEEAGRRLNLYPDTNVFYLKKALAGFHDLPESNFIVGNGSGELIDIVMKTVLSARCNIVMGAYSFILYRLLAPLYGVEINYAGATNFVNSAENMISLCNEKTAMIIVDNPCNPTGTCMAAGELDKLLDFTAKNRILLMIDEAYFEYADSPDYKSMIPSSPDFKNLIVTRTFSKVYGLAGIRAGYAVACTELISHFEKARIPFNVNMLAQQAAIAALKDQAFIGETVRKTKEGLNYLNSELGNIGIETIPTQTNFVMARIPCHFSGCIESLMKTGIIVRPLVNYGLGEYMRITSGTMEQNIRLIKTLKQMMTEQEENNE